MLRPSRQFGKRENVAALHCEFFNLLLASAFARRRASADKRGERGEGEEKLPSRPQFQALQPGGDVKADLALQAERLQGDRIGRAADKNVATGADADRRAALRARVVAGEIARTEPLDRRVHAPGECGFLRDAEIDADLADGGDVAVLRHPVDAQHATEIGHGADNKADAGAAAAFEYT